ncbi:MAG: hypothetical protein U0T77_10635 [Chitinophagales bacterium]
MTTYKVYLQPEEGHLLLHFNPDGRINGFDFTNSKLTDLRLENIFRNMPITETEFIRRADGGGTKYEKLQL